MIHDQEAEPLAAPSAEARLQDHQAMRAMLGGLQSLPEREKQTLELWYREGLSQREIARRTQTPLGTVKSRMRIATRRLAACCEA